MNENHPMKL